MQLANIIFISIILNEFLTLSLASEHLLYAINEILDIYNSYKLRPLQYACLLMINQATHHVP